MKTTGVWPDRIVSSVASTGTKFPAFFSCVKKSTPGFASDLQVMQMDLAGVMVSAGSACSSGKVKASKGVTAMGRDDLAPYVLRVSGGWGSTESDWNTFTEAWLNAHAQHRQRHAAQPAA